MSDFQNKLNEEIEKRSDDNHAEGVDSQNIDTTSKTKNIVFSFKTFIIGLLLGLFILGGLIGWATLTKNNIALSIQDRLPSKTAIVKQIESQDLHLGDTQPVLTMPATSVEKPVTATVLHDMEEKEDSISKEEQDIINMIAENQQTSEKKNTPFHLFKQPFDTVQNKPKLAIVITDLGLSKSKTEAIIKNLPSGISVAFSPYAEDAQNFIASARNKGHESWFMLPMETADYPLKDTGPLTLLSGGSVEQNSDRVSKLLENAQGTAGFIPVQNHIFKAEDANINPAIKSIFEAGFAIVDGTNSRQGFATDIGYRNDYPYGMVNYWLDRDLTPNKINQSLRNAMELSEAKGSAILMLSSYPASIKALQKFLNSAAAKKFQIAPLSAVIKNNE